MIRRSANDHKKTYLKPLKRREEEKTNYSKRLALVKSGQARLVVRRALNSINVQLVVYEPEGDKVLASAKSTQLEKFGWPLHKGNTPAAYLTGMLCAKRGMKKGTKEAVLDIGLVTPVHGSVVFAALKGAIDAGLKVPVSDDAFPSKERISGKHIAEYASKLSPEEYKARFSKCVSKNADPKKAEEYFSKAVSQIGKEQ
jgi:large subunit ribosomal protein L18